MIAGILYYMRQVRKGREPTLRSIAALDAVDEAVARSVEMGRPVHYTPGHAEGGLQNPWHGSVVVAGLTVMKKVADSCARRGAHLIVSLNSPEAIPIADEVMRQSYSAEGLPVPMDAVRFHSTAQLAYASGILSIYREEQPGANMLIGFFWMCAMILAEGGAQTGAMQISGTAEVSNIPFLLAASDYCLIGEELFAARAYVDMDPPHLGSLMASDLIRTITIAAIFLIWIASNTGLTWVVNLLAG
jgi:hypothetical protein